MTLNTQSLRTLDEIRAFLIGNAPVDFAVGSDTNRYRWLESTLMPFGYAKLITSLNGPRRFAEADLELEPQGAANVRIAASIQSPNDWQRWVDMRRLCKFCI